MHLTTNIGNLPYLTYTFLSHLSVISNSSDDGEDREDPQNGHPIPLKYIAPTSRQADGGKTKDVYCSGVMATPIKTK